MQYHNLKKKASGDGFPEDTPTELCNSRIETFLLWEDDSRE